MRKQKSNRVISNRGLLYNPANHPLSNGKPPVPDGRFKLRAQFQRNRDEQAAHGVNIDRTLSGARPEKRRIEKQAQREARKTDRMEQMYACAAEVHALAAQGYDVESMNGPYQYRINGELDIYPKGRKWCDIRHGIWGSYEAGELLRLVLNFQFSSIRL